jgi:hypothetical protein
VRHPVEIEDIEQLRRQEGIDDTELREAIRGLRVGDLVKVTFLTAPASAGETLPVRITRIRGDAFRGELAGRPASARLSELRLGSPVTFTRDHIHSIVNQPPTPRR